jgi:hypothetical protein
MKGSKGNGKHATMQRTSTSPGTPTDHKIKISKDIESIYDRSKEYKLKHKS